MHQDLHFGGAAEFRIFTNELTQSIERYAWRARRYLVVCIPGIDADYPVDVIIESKIAVQAANSLVRNLQHL